jgi:MacB-like periplasmic core domain
MQLGGIEFMKQRVREHRLRSWLDSVIRDCSYGLRQLRKTPRVTFTVAVTLALGIGVNTAMFSLLNGWLLRPLPLPSPEQITVLATEQKEGSNGNFSYPDYLDFQKENESFSALFGYAFGIGGLSADGDAREIAYSCVTGNYFSALSVRPLIGRLFYPAEGEKPGEGLLVVLGYSFWQSKFGRDQSCTR